VANWISALSYIHKYSEFPPKLAVEAILQPHDKAGWARIAEEFVVLIARKTTKQDLSKHQTLTSGRRPSGSASPGYSEAVARAMHTIDHRGPTAWPFKLSEIPIRSLHGFVHLPDLFPDRIRLNSPLNG
jgi:hypothetical protein